MRVAQVPSEKLRASAVRLRASASDGGGGLCALATRWGIGLEGLGGGVAVVGVAYRLGIGGAQGAGLFWM